MQVSFSQNAFIHICGVGDGSQDNNNEIDSDCCGTFLEIHRSNGSPYDSESTILSETKITAPETNGMYTTVIDLTYKRDKRKILCAYQETKIRIGSMVRILDVTDSEVCCSNLS